MKAAAITGMGIISSLGDTIGEVALSLEKGRSGIVLDRSREEKGFKSGLTSSLEDFSPDRWGFTKKSLRTMGEPALFASAAAMDAVKDSGLPHDVVASDRCGVVFGNDSTVRDGVEAIDTARRDGETRCIGSGAIFKSMNSTVTMNLAACLGTRGANWTISAACASSAHAIGQALMLIRSGFQDAVITGGAQELNWMGMASFDALNVFSSRKTSPQEASRPFDRDRDGLVPGGGAACLVIEALDQAEKRGAEIHAIIEGYGFSSGIGRNLSQPDAEGSARAMTNALKDAGTTADAIDYINAHATSTPAGDLAEAAAINRVFGNTTAVSSTKSMTGHECWMSGASEVIYSVLMANNSFIAPNINFRQLDDNCPAINVISKTTPAVIRRSLSNSFGFGGTNSALVLKFI